MIKAEDRVSTARIDECRPVYQTKEKEVANFLLGQLQKGNQVLQQAKVFAEYRPLTDLKRINPTIFSDWSTVIGLQPMQPERILSKSLF